MCKSNQASLDMVISKFSHTEGLTFIIGERKKFKQVIHISSCAGLEYKPLRRQNIISDLLDINYKRYTDTNSKDIIKEDKID